MRGGRILWGQIIVVFTIVLVMVWTSTQWVAFRLGFQPQLGNPWFDVAGWPVYYPPAFFWWWFSYDAYAPGIFTEGAFIAIVGTLGGSVSGTLGGYNTTLGISGDGTNLILTVVPEPTTALLGGLASLALFRRRRVA